MIRPHLHHILFKKGIGEKQQALVKEGQDILRRHGIDPINGPENLTIAPNIKGQHTHEALKPLVDRLRELDESGVASKRSFERVLEEYGEIARNR